MCLIMNKYLVRVQDNFVSLQYKSKHKLRKRAKISKALVTELGTANWRFDSIFKVP